MSYYPSAQPYQPTDREPTEEERARIKADIALVEQETRLRKAQADKAEVEVKDSRNSSLRNDLYLEQAKLSLQNSRLITAQYGRRDLLERHASGDFGVFEFNREVKGDSQGFFGFSPGTIEPMIAKLTAWSEANSEKPIKLIINSPGGGVSAGFRLFDHLRELSSRGHHITTVVSGMAASMGGVLAQAGDTRLVGSHSELMLHQASSMAWGPAYSIADASERLNKLGTRIAQIFADRSKGKTDLDLVLEKWDRRDWWMYPEEALERGFVDKIINAEFQPAQV